MNLAIFIVGFLIFIIYVYFLLTSIKKEDTRHRNDYQESYDDIDMDGIGNQGRFPNK